MSYVDRLTTANLLIRVTKFPPLARVTQHCCADESKTISGFLQIEHNVGNPVHRNTSIENEFRRDVKKWQ